jgi:hypothetical protein
LESTNPNPPPNGYSHVVSWIDEESLGIVEAYAYDANGKKLKNFYPKNFEKVNGQYQVQSLIMENLQTGSKTTLEFDLKKWRRATRRCAMTWVTLWSHDIGDTICSWL